MNQNKIFIEFIFMLFRIICIKFDFRSQHAAVLIDRNYYLDKSAVGLKINPWMFLVGLGVSFVEFFCANR